MIEEGVNISTDREGLGQIKQCSLYKWKIYCSIVGYMLTFTLEKEAMLIKLHVTKLSYINIFPPLYKIFL